MSGRQGYRKPDAKGDRLTFRPTQSLKDAIELHRFPGEDTQPLLNRLLRNLAKQRPPELPGPSLWGDKLKPVSFRPEPTVYDFYRRWEPKFPTSQQTLERLVNLATGVDVVEAIATPAAAHTFLVEKFGFDRVEVSDCLKELTEYCSEKYAKDFLSILHKDGAIHLIQGSHRDGIEMISVGKVRSLYVEIRAKM